MSTRTVRRPLPALVRRTNRIVRPLLRLGVPIGSMYLLTVNGRRSGLPRTTPVATFEYEGGRYLLQAIPRADWVANVRAAGWAFLGRGPRRPRVSLVEVPLEQRPPMLLHVGSMAPAMLRRQFVEVGLVDPPDGRSFAEALAEAASRIAVFRIDRRGAA